MVARTWTRPRMAWAWHILVSALLSQHAHAAPPDPGPSGDAVRRAAAFPALSVADAGIEGLRWVAWADGVPPSSTVRIALINTRRGTEPVWSMTVPDAYDPRFLQVAPWTHAGHPVYALTLHFGAAAEQVDLFGVEADGKPAHLASMLGDVIGFAIGLHKASVVVYSRPDSSVMVPRCYEWQDRRGKLLRAPCAQP